MPVQIQCTSVVIQNESLDRVLDGGSGNFHSIAPNSMSYSDDRLSQASFMSTIDAEEFARSLELRGLQRTDPSPDFVIVQAHDRSVEPPCDWLVLFEYDQRLIATLSGSESRTVIAPAAGEHHDPKSIEHYSSDEIAEKFEFVERNDGVDTYREIATGRLVYHARQTESPDEIFRRSLELVWRNRREPGRPELGGVQATEIQTAIESLQSLAAQNPNAPQVALALGMAWFAVGKEEEAQKRLEYARELDSENITVLKELAGVYLARKEMPKALETSTAAVAIAPDDIELLGNLAVSQLLNGEASRAETTIQRALQISPKDAVNENIHAIVNAVLAGNREQPESLEQMMRLPKQRYWWSRLIGR